MSATGIRKDIHLVDVLFIRIGITATKRHHCRGLLFIGDIIHGLTKQFISITVKQSGELHRIIILLIGTGIGEVTILAFHHIVNPDTLLAGLQDKGETGILTTTHIVDFPTAIDIQAIVEEKNENTYQQKSCPIRKNMVKVINFPYLVDLQK